MEDTHWVAAIPMLAAGLAVLILVLMEDTHWVLDKLADAMLGMS